MSPGAVAVTAIIVSGTQCTALIVAGAVLIYARRILLAASPKPQLSKQGSEAEAKGKPDAAADKTVPFDAAARRTG